MNQILKNNFDCRIRRLSDSLKELQRDFNDAISEKDKKKTRYLWTEMTDSEYDEFMFTGGFKFKPMQKVDLVDQIGDDNDYLLFKAPKQ